MEDQCSYTRKDLDNQEDLDLFNHKLKQNNIDSALNELGMLSTITNSRLEYIKEQKLDYLIEKRKKSSNLFSSSPLCVLHMNSEFVTQFSLSKNPVFLSECESSDDAYEMKSNFKYKECKKRKRKFSPYIAKKQVFRRLFLYGGGEPCKRKSVIHVEDQASPRIVTRQDSGNKSNPSSPVKSQNSATSVRCSIFRSRSLDDLKISKLDNLNKDTYDLGSNGEIDTVSQRISELHVS